MKTCDIWLFSTFNGKTLGFHTHVHAHTHILKLTVKEGEIFVENVNINWQLP